MCAVKSYDQFVFHANVRFTVSLAEHLSVPATLVATAL